MSDDERVDHAGLAPGPPVVDHRRLEVALAEFAALLLDDFVVTDVLQQLCEHALQVLPASGAGVSLREADDMHVAWATGPAVRELEGLQRGLGEGPCGQVLEHSRPVQVRLREEVELWPRYAPAALELGVRSILALPLQARGRIWGVIDIYRDSERPFDDEELHAAQTLTDVATAYLVTAWERSARREAEDKLRLQALHDPLTGLPNRVLLLDRLDHALAGVARQPDSVGVLFLDLDRFKQVNDAHGHDAGDRLLVAVARRLEQVVRPSDTLCRLGGDEFVVLCEDLQVGGSDLSGIAQRLLDALSAPFPLAEDEVVVRGSVGAVLATADDLAEQVLRDADVGMYAAKRAGGGVVVSDRRSDPELAAAIRTETELQRAVERGELRVFYQPVVSLQRGEAVAGAQQSAQQSGRQVEGRQGMEALLRWEHPHRGLLPAAVFLPVLERTGLISQVGEWVLRQVCLQLHELRPAAAEPDWFVAVNVSARQLRAPGFGSRVEQILAETGVEPAQLMLEVTETALVSRVDRGLAVLRELAHLGLRVAIDDFGTGYSSLAYLTQLPADTLKIDKMFVDGLGHGGRNEALVRGTVSLAHELGLRVIAEGIETAEQHDLLVDAGCDAGQGYLYGAAVSRSGAA